MLFENIRRDLFAITFNPEKCYKVMILTATIVGPALLTYFALKCDENEPDCYAIPAYIPTKDRLFLLSFMVIVPLVLTFYALRCEKCLQQYAPPNYLPIKQRVMLFLAMIAGPLLLIYLALRCEKNQCILFQLPLVIPTYFSAYWSPLSPHIICTFTIIMFLISSAADRVRGQPRLAGLSIGFLSLICGTLFLMGVAYMAPGDISAVYNEYLRLLVTTTVFCFCISTAIFLLIFPTYFNQATQLCKDVSFFYGFNNTRIIFWTVELKYFFYVHMGLVAWGLLDMIIFLNILIENRMTTSVAFLMISQYLLIGHTLQYERFISSRPFRSIEGLGFFWLMKVLMYLPFLNSLPLYYAATTEYSLSKPGILTVVVLYLFGFVLNIGSIHQRVNFTANPNVYKHLRSFESTSGLPVLADGFWGIVQKPDYLGYIIIWISWTMACGFSALSVVVLVITIGIMFKWLRKSKQCNEKKFGTAWFKYTAVVPKQIIPYVY